MTELLISELARRSEVPASTLRYYEREGLLPAARTRAGYRVFDERAVQRLGFIGAAKRLGLPLQAIAELLTVWEAGSCRSVKRDLRPAIATRIEQTDTAIAELVRLRGDLVAAGERLDALPDRDGRCDPTCVFLRGDLQVAS